MTNAKEKHKGANPSHKKEAWRRDQVLTENQVFTCQKGAKREKKRDFENKKPSLREGDLGTGWAPPDRSS